MRALILEARYVVLRKVAQQRIAKAEREKLCVACMKPLDETAIKRGCHERCYRATMRAIESGKTTVSDRVAAGKLLESKQGQHPTNPVSLEFA